MFIILTDIKNDDRLTGEPSVMRDAGRSWLAGSNLYRTREEAQVQANVLADKWAKQKKAVDAAEEAGIAFFPFGNPYKGRPTPEFVVFELTEIAATNIAQLPKLDDLHLPSFPRTTDEGEGRS